MNTSTSLKRVGDFVVLVDDSGDIKSCLTIHVSRVMVTLYNEEVWLHVDDVKRPLGLPPDKSPEDFFDNMVGVLSGADEG
ncbi:MAG: hypothetical protein WC477_06875 [Patescibacteria group bacterium]